MLLKWEIEDTQKYKSRGRKNTDVKNVLTLLFTNYQIKISDIYRHVSILKVCDIKCVINFILQSEAF